MQIAQERAGLIIVKRRGPKTSQDNFTVENMDGVRRLNDTNIFALFRDQNMLSGIRRLADFRP